MHKRLSDRFLMAVVMIGIILIIVGIVHFILGYPIGVYYFGLGFILFYLFAMIPNRILIEREGIVMKAFLRKKYFAYEDIEMMVWKCTGKILTSNYTGYLIMQKGGRRKIFSKDEETLKYLNEVIMRAKAVSYSDRDGEILYLR